MANARKPTTVAFFNNKGGVGKTTLACNFAAFAAAKNRKVAFLDLDPQCNATQLLLDDEQWYDIYKSIGSTQANERTILHSLRSIIRGDSATETDVALIASSRFSVSVVAGNPRLSLVEDKLSQSWGECRAGDIGGVRRTCWMRAVTDKLAGVYDLVIVDLGPSLGAINRCALIGSDYFVTPMASDLFSLYALENIATWMKEWGSNYTDGIEQSKKNAPDILVSFPYVKADLSISRGFVGYTTQQYVTRSSDGERKEVQAYETFRKQIPGVLKKSLKSLASQKGSSELGVVPNMFSMVPLAQAAHAPIELLTKSDGLRGAQFSQRENYVSDLNKIFATILSRVQPR